MENDPSLSILSETVLNWTNFIWQAFSRKKEEKALRRFPSSNYKRRVSSGCSGSTDYPNCFLLLSIEPELNL